MNEAVRQLSKADYGSVKASLALLGRLIYVHRQTSQGLAVWVKQSQK